MPVSQLVTDTPFCSTIKRDGLTYLLLLTKSQGSNIPVDRVVLITYSRLLGTKLTPIIPLFSPFPPYFPQVFLNFKPLNS